jgi:hypothetical protein
VKEYVVQEGDCLTSIAAAHGFRWQDLWNLQENRALRDSRDDPNVLNPADVVRIPERRLKYEKSPTDQRHEFVRLGTRAVARFRLLDTSQKPRAGLRYVATVDMCRYEDKTDADGYLTVPVSPTAEKLTLHVWNSGQEEVYELSLGNVEPVDEMKGVKDRLANLGYGVESELEDGEADALHAAISDFQRAAGLPESGELDPATRERLKAAHGS